ncbi:MAG: hypothetical protein ABR607_08705 [Pyrinomonadaceae bacterium]
MMVIALIKSKTRRAILASIMAAITTSAVGLNVVAQRRTPARHPAVCGNPNLSCPSAVTFQPYDLPFRMPRNAVIYDTDLFYAVLLRSVPSPADNCDNYIPEPERLAAQILFPNNKVFTSRCAEPGQISYWNTSPKAQFMAVYAGLTLAEANRLLASVRATGKFPGANLRRMRAMVNGT